MKLKLIFVIFILWLGGCSTTLQLKNQEGESLPVLLISYPVDEKKTAPTVLIAHGSDGVQSFHREWAQRVQSWGYNAVIIDHYSLRGINLHTGQFLQGVKGPDRARDMVQAGNWILQQSWHKGKVGIIGFSQGGGGVMALIDNQDNIENSKIINKGEKIPFSVAVAFYPSCLLSSPPIKPSIPTQIHLAKSDDLAPIRFCLPLSDPLYEIHQYEGATHAFDVYISSKARLNYTHRYDPAVAKESQEYAKVFLEKFIK